MSSVALGGKHVLRGLGEEEWRGERKGKSEAILKRPGLQRLGWCAGRKGEGEGMSGSLLITQEVEALWLFVRCNEVER